MKAAMVAQRVAVLFVSVCFVCAIAALFVKNESQAKVLITVIETAGRVLNPFSSIFE